VKPTGRILHEVVGSGATLTEREVADEPAAAGAAIPGMAIPGMGGGEPEGGVSDTEADEMEEHLRGLGYLE
jgi:hypothetical protein